MSLIAPIRQTPIAATVKETIAQWRGYFFPVSMEAKIVIGILTVLGLWGLAIFTFGVPALVWPMMLIVPGVVLGLVLLTLGM